MSAAVLTLLATLFVGGLALLAQAARKSREAEVTLVVVLLVLSLLIASLGTVTGLGLVIEATAEGGTGSARLALAAAGGAALLVGVVGVGLCVPPLLKVLGNPPAAGFWSDPPVFLALWLFVMVLANNALSFLIFTQTQDVSRLFPTGRLSPTVLVTSQLPFVAVALLGVGLGVRRNLRGALGRLGYGAISVGQVGVVALFVVAALVLAAAADSLFSQLQPDLYRRVGELSDSLFNPVGMSPASAILFALMLGVGAGLGEETLFRGAVQPVLGIVPTSVLFASMHVQYGPSLLLGYVFVLSIGLGLLRRHINTTASFLAHAGYNSLGVLLAYFFGI